ncbi:unnamed protein product [Prunus armeniaca]
MNQLRVLLVTFLLAAIGVAAMPATQFRSSGGILDTHIRITNGLGPDVDLSIHCKSADDDLGEHLIHYETWPGQFHWFDIFIQDRDNCENCAWLIKADGPRRFNSETRSYDDGFGAGLGGIPFTGIGTGIP